MLNSSENLRTVSKSAEVFGNFLKLRKRFNPAFKELKRFLSILEILWIHLRTFLENFGNGPKWLKSFRENFGTLQKCSDIIGKFLDVIGTACNISQELKSFGADYREVLKRTPAQLFRARNDGKVEWNTTRCILPVASRALGHNCFEY